MIIQKNEKKEGKGKKILRINTKNTLALIKEDEENEEKEEEDFEKPPKITLRRSSPMIIKSKVKKEIDSPIIERHSEVNKKIKVKSLDSMKYNKKHSLNSGMKENYLKGKVSKNN